MTHPLRLLWPSADRTCGHPQAPALKRAIRAQDIAAVERVIGAVDEPVLRGVLVESLGERWWASEAAIGAPSRGKEPGWRSGLWGFLNVELAWKARGGNVASEVGDTAAARFERHLEEALVHLQAAAAADEADPWPMVWALRVAKGLGFSRGSADSWYAEGQRRSPRFAPLEAAMQSYLLPRWHGSVEVSLEHASTVCGDTPPDHPALLVAALLRINLLFLPIEDEPLPEAAAVATTVHDLAATASRDFAPTGPIHPLIVDAHGAFLLDARLAKDKPGTRRHLHGLGGFLPTCFHPSPLGRRMVHRLAVMYAVLPG